jgi:hypothetical protein
MEVLNNLFWVPFVAVFGFLIFRLLKYGSFRGMLYGSAVARTIGEVELERKWGTTTTLRVHVLENGKVVLEHSSRALLSASLNGNTLTQGETERLIALLLQARS